MKVLTILSLVSAVVALDNGFGRTPVMGYNTYNDVGCSPNSQQVESAIRSLKNTGLQALGYKYFQVDCGWQGYQRLSNGSITYDASVFPNGIKPLSDLARSLGFVWSMYTDQGVNSCDTRYDKLRPGSLGYEKEDAAMFAAWNTGYVKVDNCFVESGQNAPKNPRTDYPSRYGKISTALQNAGIKGILVCQWGAPYASPNGLQGPAAWTPPLSTSYRVSDDIAQGYGNVQRIMNQAIHVSLKNLTGPGHFADMDLLTVGNPGMSTSEQQTHFAIWATFKSALMISTNPGSMSADAMRIFSNKDLIAINQDTLGSPVKLIQRFSIEYDVFSGPLSNGDRVVLIVDQSNNARQFTFNLKDVGVESANVKEAWTGATASRVISYTQTLAAYGSIVLRLSSIKLATSVSVNLRYYEAEAAQFSDGAQATSCSGCSNGQKAGWIGSNAAVTFRGIRTSQTTTNVRFDYINCEISYLGDQSTNVRWAGISVNGGPVQEVSFPITGYNWDADITKEYLVKLSGFKLNQDNTIKIQAIPSKSQWAPDFDRIGMVN